MKKKNKIHKKDKADNNNKSKTIQIKCRKKSCEGLPGSMCRKKANLLGVRGILVGIARTLRAHNEEKILMQKCKLNTHGLH
jgi:hypothetical protein